MGKVERPFCLYCEDGVIDTAEHTLLECSAWAAERLAPYAGVGSPNSLSEAVQLALQSVEGWHRFAVAARTVLQAKMRRARTEAPRGS